MRSVPIAIAVPIAAGVLILGSTLATVPPEDRAIQWPVLGGISAVGLIAAAVMLRRARFALPPGGNRVPGTDARIIAFPHAA